ncbi:MAG: YfiR family protein [Bdellovibrionales bacterium]|nr:YfiR family protein [Bdellovibrionales bacterium]
MSIPRLHKFLFFSTVWLFVGFSSAVAQINEAQVKASFLLNFIKLAEFSTSVRHRQEETGLALCIGEGMDAKARDFFEALNGQSVGVRIVKVRNRYTKSCDIAFLPEDATESERKDFFSASSSKNCLSVVETSEDFQKGGIIAFTEKERKVRFQVILSRIKASDIRLSSQLLRLADIVE